MIPALLAAALAAAPAPAPTRAVGTLVIVGGALDGHNDAVFAALIGAMPADARDVVIVPAASGSPRASADAFAQDLVRHGVARDRIVMAKVAAVDDPDTKDVDESRWRDNASDPATVALVAHAGAIWFAGGDQARIVATLRRADGSDTPLLAAIRARLAAGAVVGGSSAGAAIMSAPMILQGDSVGALWPDFLHLGERLGMGRGLGFLPHGLVDQHFDTRARLGRLTMALGTLPAAERIGFGIDENTALVIDLAHGSARAIGAGYVTTLDARHARYRSGYRAGAAGITLGLAGGGDTIDLMSGAVTPAPYKVATIGREYASEIPIGGGGMALPGATTASIVGGELLDNSRAGSVDRVSAAGGAGVIFRFAKGKAARGYWGHDAGGTARYAVSGVDFAIVPIVAAVLEVKP